MSYGSVDAEMRKDETHTPTQARAGIIFGAVAAACLCSIILFHDSLTTGKKHGASVELYEAGSKASPPNIIYILADDLSWNSMGYMGTDLAEMTPFLDSVAAEGIIFTNFYGQHICTPARAALLTGKYPAHLGMQFGAINVTSTWGLPAEVPTLPEVLQQSGYRTHMVGKWHLGHSSPSQLPTSRGFETFLGYLLGAEHYFSHNLPGDSIFGQYYDFVVATKTQFRPAFEYADQYSGRVLFDRAKEIIKTHEQSSPLFMYIATQNVHAPLDALPDEWFTTEEASHISAVRGDARREYAKSLLMLDKLVRELFHQLRESGMLENTYVIFSGDNGGCAQGGGHTFPLRGSKGSLYEGGMKVPAFVWSPLLPTQVKGTVFEGIAHISDWFPTILSLTGAGSPSVDGLDGKDLSPLLLGLCHGNDCSAIRTELFYNAETNVPANTVAFVDAPLAIRVGRYKLVYEYEGGWHVPSDTSDSDDLFDEDGGCTRDTETVYTGYLFDLFSDPFEERNLIDENTEIFSGSGTIKDYLLARLEKQLQTVRPQEYQEDSFSVALQAWEAAGNVVVPWKT